MKKTTNNKGFSLLEVLIVVAIMAVMATLSVVIYSIVDRANIEKAANSFEAAFTKARTMSLAKGTEGGQLTILMGGDGYWYYTIGDPSTANPERLCSDHIKVKFDGLDTCAAEGSTDMSPTGFNIKFNPAGMIVSNTLGGTRITFSRMSGTAKRIMEFKFYEVTGKSSVTKYFL